MHPPGGDNTEAFPSAVQSGMAACGVTDSSVLVAVSGGPDSVALLTALVELRETLGLRPVVGHVNHRLRDTESDADAEWVHQLATEFALPCHVRIVEQIPGSATGESLEESARRMRYELLTDVAVETDCTCVAVAHTADDQVETILHHLIRGTGLAGLRGMPRSRALNETVQLVRPMLSISRDAVESWLTSIGQSARIDVSNSDTRLTRNRIRRELLPTLENDFNPQIRRVLQTLSTQAEDLSDFVGAHAESLLQDVTVIASPECLRIGCEAFGAAPQVLVREALRHVWQNHNWPQQRMSFRDWQRLAEIAIGGGAASLPGRIDARKRGTLLVLTRTPTR